MKLAVCNEFFEDWKIEDIFNYAAEIGCDGVEIAPFTLAESVTQISAKQRSDIRKAAEKAGVEIVGCTGYSPAHRGFISRIRTKPPATKLRIISKH